MDWIRRESDVGIRRKIRANFFILIQVTGGDQIIRRVSHDARVLYRDNI